ncbi:condensation domain-containing protein [Brevibacillus laterosporus]
MAESIQGLVQKYDMFRSVFRYKKVDPVQVVLSERKIDLQIEDLTQINEEEQRKFIEEYRKKTGKEALIFPGISCYVLHCFKQPPIGMNYCGVIIIS